ncbi:MAG TPA: Fur family transcriptional regulator [Candidatus Saccharimonadales bacterium]
MSSARDSFRNLLKQHGYSVTKARLRVFEALLGREPLSMHDLVNGAGQVDRASVYRAVEVFERLGIVQRLHTGWKYKLELTDKFAEHHHHLTCTQCGKTVAMNEDDLERLIAKLAAAHHFLPSAHQIELQGLCADCQGLVL